MVPSETGDTSSTTNDKNNSSLQPSSTVKGLAGSSMTSIAPKSLELQRFNQIRCVVEDGRGGEEDTMFLDFFTSVHMSLFISSGVR